MGRGVQGRGHSRGEEPLEERYREAGGFMQPSQRNMGNTANNEVVRVGGRSLGAMCLGEGEPSESYGQGRSADVGTGITENHHCLLVSDVLNVLSQASSQISMSLCLLSTNLGVAGEEENRLFFSLAAVETSPIFAENLREVQDELGPPGCRQRKECGLCVHGTKM